MPDAAPQWMTCAMINLWSVAVMAQSSSTPPVASSSDAAVQLSDVNVSVGEDTPLTKFDDKASAETLTETISETALKNSNNQSSTDLIKDVAGVAVSKGANGSSSVSIRGIDQRMLRITVDGQRQGGSGNPLDSIPPEIVQSLEVTKTFTPDMEADTVGGTININTGGVIIKNGYVQGRHQLTYNTNESRPGVRNSFTVAEPYALFNQAPNASFMTTGSFDDNYATRERISTLREWTAQLSPASSAYAGQLVPTLTLPVIESTREHRQRSGWVLNSDARLNDLAVYWRSNFNRDWAKRARRMDDTNPASGTAVLLTPSVGTFSGVSLSRRAQQQTSQRDTLNASLGAKNTLQQWELDGALSYGNVHELEPQTVETQFLSDQTYRVTYDLSGNAYAPNFTVINEANAADTHSQFDASHYRFNYLSVLNSNTREQEGTSKFNAKLNLQNDGNYLKFGGKLQQRHRNANIERAIYHAGSTTLSMSSVLDDSTIDLQTLPYQIGPVPNAGAVKSLLSSSPNLFSLNSTQTAINSTTGDVSTSETIWALYGMGRWRLTPLWTLISGARIEGTKVHAVGEQMTLDNTGQLQGFQRVAANNRYVEVLPGLHLRYEPQVGLLYRGSITRSMSRPSNADLAPFRTVSFIDHRSRIGSPELKPYLATNFDVSVDVYRDHIGLLSAAVFYKKIDHFITDAQYPVSIGNLGEFIEFKRINGDTAFAYGSELSWQSQSATLPGHLGKGSVEANYNYNHGEAHFPNRPGEVFPLPRQVDHQASLKLHDVAGKLSVDADLSYRSGWWEDQIAPGFDNYITSAWDAQLNSAYKLGKQGRLTVGVSNLFNHPVRHYAGIASRFNDSQTNGIDYNLGVQWKL